MHPVGGYDRATEMRATAVDGQRLDAGAVMSKSEVAETMSRCDNSIDTEAQMKETRRLTYVELDRRISELPEGPVAVLNRPRWQYWTDMVGGIGMIVGLLPSLLVVWYTPATWMLRLAQAGLAVTITGFFPGFARNLWSLCRSIKEGRQGFLVQWDHDYDAHQGLQIWLEGIPLETLARRRRFAAMIRDRMATKIGLLLGDLDRLGVLPLIVSIYLQVKAVLSEGLEIPTWQVILALFVAITYLIGLWSAFLRTRIQLHESILEEALARRPRRD